MNTECVIDISVGGWLMPSVEKGFLSVWTVTNSGYVKKEILFFRF